MRQPLIELKSISKTFGPASAVDQVDLQVMPGEIVCMLGCNGAGKSTITRILNGELQPDSGTLYVNGAPVSIADPKDAKELGIAVCPQNLQIFENMSIAENLFLGGEGLTSRGLRNRRGLMKKASDILCALGLDADPAREAGTLSYAEKYLVQFGRVLSARPRVIVLDELTAALTTREAEVIYEHLRRLTSGGAGIIYITHSTDEAMHIADRVVIVRDGRVEWKGSREEAAGTDLGTIMFGETRAKHYPKLPVPIKRPFLRIRNLSTAFVDEVSLDLHESEIIGIAGVAGSGRTRLLRAIAGLDPAWKGTILFDGKDLSGRSGPYRGLGYLPDERDKDALFLNWGTGSNITVQSIASGASFAHPMIDHAREDLIARDQIERLGISGSSPGTSIVDLSNGNKQKTVISRCISSNCRAFLFDEPTQAVDAAGKVDIYNIMNRLLAIGAGIIMASSDLTELTNMCDRIFVVRKGKIVAEMDPNEADPGDALELLI